MDNKDSFITVLHPTTKEKYCLKYPEATGHIIQVIDRNETDEEMSFNEMMQTCQPTTVIKGEAVTIEDVQEEFPEADCSYNNIETVKTTLTPTESHRWTEQETKLLLSTYAKYANLLASGKMLNKDLWIVLSKKLNVSVAKCQTKMDTLRRKYKEVKNSAVKTGTVQTKWIYFDDMEAIFHEKPMKMKANNNSALQNNMVTPVKQQKFVDSPKVIKVMNASLVHSNKSNQIVVTPKVDQVTENSEDTNFHTNLNFFLSELLKEKRLARISRDRYQERKLSILEELKNAIIKSLNNKE